MTQTTEELIAEVARGVEAGDWKDLVGRLSSALASEKARAPHQGRGASRLGDA